MKLRTILNELSTEIYYAPIPNGLAVRPVEQSALAKIFNKPNVEFEENISPETLRNRIDQHWISTILNNTIDKIIVTRQSYGILKRSGKKVLPNILTGLSKQIYDEMKEI